MKKTVTLIGLLALLNGCVIKETTIRETAPAPVSTEDPLVWQPSNKSANEKQSCDLMYTTYKQCYGLGIQLNSTEKCIDSGGELAHAISQRWGSRDLGTALGSVCAVACASANQNMAMPSYGEFSNTACN